MADIFDLTPDLTPQQLRRERSSVKWAGLPDDVLPMFIAEMDFTVDAQIIDAVADQVRRSDLGYARDLTELAEAFAGFAADRWGWRPNPAYLFGSPDVSFGVKGVLRHLIPAGSRVALTTPVYPSFFGYLSELLYERVEVPLAPRESGRPSLDLDALNRAFSGTDGAEPVRAMILSNPHNPHGIAFSKHELDSLATLAAEHGILVIADEIHAPLTHHGVTFTPFAPLAAAHGTPSVTVTSASKGWNVAGTKCALIYAPPETASDDLRTYLDEALGYSVSILGRTANTVAFRDAVPWLDAVVTKVAANGHLLADLLAEHVPGARYTPPETGYLAWVDLRDAGLGENPAETLLHEALVMVSDGATFGEVGHGHVRINLGCSEELLREAVKRIGSVVRR